MKRLALILLALLLLTFPACDPRNDLPTMKIVTDEGIKEVPMVTMVTDVNWVPDNLSSVLRTVPGNDKDFKVTFEALPLTEPERSNRLTRLRTEMMAGKGPDLFLINLENSSIFTENTDSLLEPLFPFPEKSMKNRMFLPLDGYMENARFTDFSKFLPELMELCRNDEGQQIIPLTYNFEICTFNASASDIPLEKTGTREDMLNSGSPVLEYFAGSLGLMSLDYFGTPADYYEETLNFTEDELFEQAMLWNEHFRKLWAGEYASVLELEGFSHGPTIGLDLDNSMSNIPYRNRDGGVTASVSIIAAINRNASYPQEAFAVIDKIASESVMRDEALYSWSGGIVANTELGSPDKPLQWLHMTQEAYDAYRELLDQVTVIKFPTRLEKEVYEEVCLPCVNGELEDEDDVRAAVHRAYMTMQMMLAES